MSTLKTEPAEKHFIGVVERVKIMQEIAVERTKKPPTPWKAIVKRYEAYDVTQRTLERWLKTYLERNAELKDPTGITNDTIDMYGESIEMCGQAAVRAHENGNFNGMIGSLRLMVELQRGRVALLMTLGRIPKNVGDYEARESMAQMIRRMAEVVEKHDLSAEVVSDLIAIVDAETPVAE